MSTIEQCPAREVSSGERAAEDPYNRDRRTNKPNAKNNSTMETNSQDGGSPSRSTQMLVQMISQMSEQLQTIQRDQHSLRTEREADRAERETDREEARAQIRALQSAIATPMHISPGEIVNPTPQRIAHAPILNVTSPSLGTVTGEIAEERLSKRKATLPNPQRFDGTRRKFRAWQLEMRSKLRVDGPAIGGPPDQFAYIYSRLDETPQAMAAAYFEKGGQDGQSDPAGFLAYLTTCYGDPNTEQRALSRLETMRQGPKENFATFLPKFEKELADSGGATWGDPVKINSLKRVINGELRSHLAGQLNLPTRYPEFVNALQCLGANLDELRFYNRNQDQLANQSKHRNQRQKENSSQPPTAQKEETTDQMDWEPTKAGKAGSGRKSSRKPMDKTGPQCYSCEGYGHIARECANERKKEATVKEKPGDGKKSSKAGHVKPKRGTSSQDKDESDSESQYDTASDQESEKE